jgi:hypothetical protein
MEDEMTKFQMQTRIMSAAAIALMAGAMAVGAPPKAEAKSIFDCRADTRLHALTCCNEWIRDHNNRKPFWMQESRSNCEAAVVCVKRKRPGSLTAVAVVAPLRCYVRNTLVLPDGSSSDGGPTGILKRRIP